MRVTTRIGTAGVVFLFGLGFVISTEYGRSVMTVVGIQDLMEEDKNQLPPENNTKTVDDHTIKPIPQHDKEEFVPSVEDTISYYSDPKYTQREAERIGKRWRESTVQERTLDPFVAVCMVGAARTLYEPHVYKSIRHNLLETLSKNSIVFAQIKLWDAKMKIQPIYGMFRPINVTTLNISRALRYIRPTMLKIETEKKDVTNHRCNISEEYAKSHRKDKLFTGDNSDRLVGIMEAMANCYHTVERFEKQANMSFDAVARARPDVVWFYPAPKAQELLQRGNRVSFLWDLFIFVARRYGYAFTTWYDQYMKCTGVWEGDYTPETAYYSSFKAAGMMSHVVDTMMPIAIRRVNIGEPSAKFQCHKQRRISEPDCWKLMYDAEYNDY
uniref:Uncharacterized protein n=1 Tax=Lotharella oceanica TaxID=641309 RepID=A0A7S2TGN7_9EUKA|mmetsp:Transcript_12873/g.24574  ORF Transcript_12873/g.24574 Transcript_12873/m.24574 type:complete len:384 (+) Transcript_12873:48-1199(+)